MQEKERERRDVENGVNRFEDLSHLIAPLIF